MRIALQTIYTQSWKHIADIVLRNFWEYADRHGYRFVVKELDNIEPLNLGYKKIEEIQLLFKEKICDIVFQVDLDAVFTNKNIPIERFIDEYHDAFITNTVNGINCGAFVIKDTGWSYDFLNWLMKQKGKEGMYCEQDAWVAYMKEYPKSPIKIVGHPSFNSFDYSLYPEHSHITKREDGNWHEGDLLLHLPGISMEQREKILKEKIWNTK